MATRTSVDDIREVANLSGYPLVEAAEHGLPTECIAQLRELGLTFTEVAEIVIAPRTLKHRQSRGERLSTDESERVLRISRTLKLADQVFGNRDKTLKWLRIPDPRQNDRTPLSLLRTEAGGKAVENALWQIDDGIYS